MLESLVNKGPVFQGYPCKAWMSNVVVQSLDWLASWSAISSQDQAGPPRCQKWRKFHLGMLGNSR